MLQTADVLDIKSTGRREGTQGLATHTRVCLAALLVLMDVLHWPRPFYETWRVLKGNGYQEITTDTDDMYGALSPITVVTP